ncbi:hypothetical protein MHK_008531, partial [Candidatus Magnetomorum sp. HK-1]
FEEANIVSNKKTEYTEEKDKNSKSNSISIEEKTKFLNRKNKIIEPQIRGFASFEEESNKATKFLNCKKPKITPANYGLGALYGCVSGKANSVKWFINEVPNTNKVENVKLMWNDWFIDIGEGLHTDKEEAKRYIDVLSNLYAPELKNKLKKSFFLNKNREFRSGSFILKYTYYHGHKIDERLIVITEK